MTGKLYQLKDSDDDNVGVIWTKDGNRLTQERIEELWQEYYPSDEYDTDGSEGFAEHLRLHGYSAVRVYIENVNL